MITTKVNGRTLSVWFCYKKQYSIDVPRKLTHAQRKLACVRCGFTKGHPAHLDSVKAPRDHVYLPPSSPEPRFERVQRPLTQCYIAEGTGPKHQILSKIELRLNHKDKPFNRRSPEAEKLRKFLLEGVMRKANLSKDERRCLWHAFLSRNTVRPNILDPGSTPSTPPPAASAKQRRPIEVVDVKSVVNLHPADTVPEGRRIVVSRRTAKQSPAAPEPFNEVPGKVVFIPRPWHYPSSIDLLMQLPLQDGERIH